MKEIKISSLNGKSFEKLKNKNGDIIVPSYNLEGNFASLTTPKHIIKWKKEFYKTYGKGGTLYKEDDVIYWLVKDNKDFDKIWQSLNPWE